MPFPDNSSQTQWLEMTSHTWGLADVRPAWQLCQPSTPLAPRCVSAALGLAGDTQLVAMCVVRGPAEACSLVAMEWHRTEPRRTPDVCTSPSTKKLQSLHSVPLHVHFFLRTLKPSVYLNHWVKPAVGGAPPAPRQLGLMGH